MTRPERQRGANICPVCGVPTVNGQPFCSSCGRRVVGRDVGGLVGHTIGDWNVHSLLGEGGMGEVYLAKKRVGGKTNIESVVKVPRVKNLNARQKAGVVNQLFEEAETLRNLSHSHIVPFQDIISYMDSIVLIMRYIPGIDLATLIHRTYDVEKRRLSWNEIREYARGVLDALQFAHSHPTRPIIHGDVKPTNVRIEKGTGTPWLIDFGLAWALWDSDVTIPVGTLPYSAPEVLSKDRVGPAADLYSVGVTLYELLTGSQAFPADGRGNALEQLDFVREHSPESLGQLRKDLPPHVAEAIHKAMSLDPDQRFYDCEEFLNAVWEPSQITFFPGSSGGRKRRPGSRFGSYELSQRTAVNPLWETWLAREENGETVRLCIFHNRRIWPFLGAAIGQRHTINHSSIKKVRSMDFSFRPPYLVLRADSEERLLSEILEERELTEDESYSVAAQVLRGLKALRREGVVHGLISPQTVLIKPAVGHVRLIDLRLAQALDGALERSGRGEKENMLAALPYLAPEQQRGEQASPATDIFSAARLMVRLLGKQRWVAEPDRLLARKGVNRDVVRLVRTCLDDDPAVRPHNPDLVLYRLLEATGRDMFTQGELDFVAAVVQEIESGVDSEPLQALEQYQGNFGVEDTRAFELVPAIAARLGQKRWEQFLSPHRRTYLPLVEERRNGGTLDSETRLELESIRMEHGIPRLVARYVELCPSANEMDMGGILCVRIPRGTFRMGSDIHRPDERPAHNVSLDEFFVSKYSVTMARYRRFCEESGHPLPVLLPMMCARADDHPAAGVSYLDAKAFCKWMSEKSGYRVNLPTEAQWELAAAGPESHLYPWGEEVPTDDRCVFGQVYGHTDTVATHSSGVSSAGVHDMAGNVWEWCRDWYHDLYYWESGNVNPLGPALGEKRVLRGGSYMSSPERLRCSAREREYPDVALPSYGFRIVVEMD